jgi:hypothetical protein
MLLFVLVALPGPLMGRLMEALSYEEMFAKADLVVIAKPLTNSDSDERTTIAPSVDVIGVNTEFEARLVFKGDRNVAKFVLHHYRLANPDEPLVNRPAFASFTPDESKSFLLFLMKDSDGRYVPVGGQLDPAHLSVIKLDSVAE